MPVAKVQGPDGKIHRFEVPSGATPEEIEAFAADNIQIDATVDSPPKPDVKFSNSAQPYAAGAIKGIPLGADIAGAVASAILPNPNDTPFGERQKAAKQFFDQMGEAAKEKNPYAYLGGAAATAIPTALLTPASALKGPSVMARAIKGAGVASGYGAAYGAGEGNTAEERIGNSIYQGVVSAPFGAAGSVAADIVGGIASNAGPLAKRAANFFGKIKRPEPNIIIQGTANQIDPSMLSGVQNALSGQKPSPPSMGKIPLTKGNLTQAPRTQALESGSAAGIYGDEAQRMALETRELQSDAAKNVLSQVAGKELTQDTSNMAAENLVKNLKSSYASAKGRTNAAYTKVGELSNDAPLQIAATYVRDGIVPSLKDWARKGGSGVGFDLGAAEMANGKRLYDQAATFGDMKRLSGVNFNRMEQWRGRVSQGIANSKTPAEKAFLSGLLQRYDTSMSKLPREAIKSGDEAIIGAMEKARMSRKEQGVLFERSKIVKDILQNDDLTNEQFANVLTSLGPRTGTYVRDILRTTTDSAQKAALQGQMKQAILGNVLNKALSAEVKAGSNVTTIDKMVSFDKLATEMDKLIKNRTLFEKIVTDPAERQALKEAANAAALIKSTKPGTKNYSNTAYTIFNILRSISPTASSVNVLGVGAGSGLKAMGQAGATNELAQSLAPVLKGVVEQNNIVTNFGKQYGRQTFVGAATGAKRELGEE
jgi:hypothetical protein